MKNYRFKVKRNAKKNVLGMRVMFKKCTKCGEILFRNEFTKNKSHYTGLTPMCRVCTKNRYVLICECCGEEFKSEVKTRRFCSKKCMGENIKGENHHRYKKIKCYCSYCNKEIEITEGKYKKYKNHYCNKECESKHRSVIYSGENHPCYDEGCHIKHNCDYCGKEFETTKERKSKSKNHFCSVECKNKFHGESISGKNNPHWSRVKCNCDYCGKEIEIQKLQYDKSKNHYCSRECQGRHRSVIYSGENHPCYNPNKTQEEREQERKYPEYSDWRKEVFKRDNYTCQLTGQVGKGDLVVHHLNGYNWCKEGRTDINNGVTLKKWVHDLFHSIYGYGDNTKEQFEEFKIRFLNGEFEEVV